MSYKIYIYALMLFLTAFALSGINFTNFFKKGYVIEAKIFISLIVLGLSYISSKYIIEFIELM